MVFGRPRRFLGFVLAFLTVLAFSGTLTRAQSGSQGTIVVTVSDSSGAVVSDATLTLTALRTNDVRTALTERNGSYSFVNLPIGTYSLNIAKSGYSQKIYDSVLVEASQSTSLSATL